MVPARSGTSYGAGVAPVWSGQMAYARRLGDIPKNMLMSDEYQRIEVITGAARRRRWPAD